VQKEVKQFLPPEKIADVEYTALKSENEVLKTSLTSEKESRKELETQIDNLKGEINHLTLQLFWANRQEKHLEEKLNLSLSRIPSSVSAKQIRKLIQSADPKTREGDVWNSKDNDELEENSDYHVSPEPIPIWPLFKTEATNESGEQAHTTVQTTHGLLLNWQYCRENIPVI